jgi:D-glycero-alpha-D-manno-heptose-7-phosphate kinase
MLVFTGQVRTASDIASELVKAISSRTTELTAMHRSVDEAVDILYNGSDLTDFGRLLDETWMTKRSLIPRISPPEIDDIYSAARKAGALGGKLLGAGGGGFMLFFVSPEQRQQVELRLDSLLKVPFQFETSGSHIIFNNESDATH